MEYKDCFAYNKNTRSCNALNEMVCADKECRFYKTRKERCDGCRKANGNTLSCSECYKRGIMI